MSGKCCFFIPPEIENKGIIGLKWVITFKPTIIQKIFWDSYILMWFPFTTSELEELDYYHQKLIVWTASNLRRGSEEMRKFQVNVKIERRIWLSPLPHPRNKNPAITQENCREICPKHIFTGSRHSIYVKYFYLKKS